jgi:hypothetical protein
MDDLHDDDDRTPARVRVSVDGVEQRVGYGLKGVFGRAASGYPSVLIALDRKSKENRQENRTYRSGSHSPSAIPNSFSDTVPDTTRSQTMK